MFSHEDEGALITLIGSFNPAIFQPRWLGSLNLIRPEEAEKAQIATIQAEIADFKTDWFHLQVLQKRLVLQSLDPTHLEPLRDLAVGIFTILPHTPVEILGMARIFHYKMPSPEAWHNVGNQLAPKDPWNSILDTPGLRSMTMEGRRKETTGGILYIKIEPSVPVKPGVYVEITEQFKEPGDARPAGAQWVSEILGKHWDTLMKYAEDAGQRLLDNVVRR